MSLFVNEINDSPLAAERAEKDILGNKIDTYYQKKLTAGSNISINDITNTISADVGVTGVKGDVETDYRVGNVNITSQNLGMGTCYNLSNTQAILLSFGDVTNFGTIKFFTSVSDFVIEFTVTVVVSSSNRFTGIPSVTMYSCRHSDETLGSSNYVPAVKYLDGDSSTPAKVWVYFGVGDTKRIRWMASTQNYEKITSSIVTTSSIDSSASSIAATYYNYLPIVTGGFNKAVGSSTNPVYVDDSGTVTPCSVSDSHYYAGNGVLPSVTAYAYVKSGTTLTVYVDSMIENKTYTAQVVRASSGTASFDIKFQSNSTFSVYGHSQTTTNVTTFTLSHSLYPMMFMRSGRNIYILSY